ncbi:translation initiation factor IF-2 [candidate division KSB1 bacterium]|nr:translation initiation factor IF-2 [candidate division KSB1 bacterium]
MFQIAREFNVSNEAIISYLTGLKYQIRNHMTLLTDEMYDDVMKKFGDNVGDVHDDEYDFKRELKEKRAREKEKQLEEEKRYQEKVRASMLIQSKTAAQHKSAKAGGVGEVQISDEELKSQDAAAEEEKVQKLKKTTREKEITPAKDKVKSKTRKPSKGEVQEEDVTISPDAEEAVSELISPKKKVEPTLQEEKQKEVSEVTPETAAADKKEPKKKTEVDTKPDERSKPRDKVAEVKEEIKRRKEAAALPSDEAKVDKGKPKKKLRKKLKAKERLDQPGQSDEDGSEKKFKKKKKKDHVQEPAAEVKQEKFKKKGKKKKKFKISEEEVEESIRQTLSLMEDGGKGKKRRKRVKAVDDDYEDEEQILKVHEYISVSEFAAQMDLEPSDVIKKCLEYGILASINHRLDEDTIVTIADEFGYKVEIVPEYGSDKFEEQDEEEDAVPRPPVVTIMGHVDHGKTSLLDYIRNSNITESEAGGITQHIGAYEVSVNGRSITFLDTPGHEAFTAMRARGAQATDIVVLIIAADDSVMPQTVEAINHSKAAGVPIIVAINKIDKSNANPEMIKKQLAEHDILVEGWGGKYQCIEISAKFGEGVDKLLDSILLEAEMLELKANPDRLARGVVIESELDKGMGIVATVLVQKGTLKIGDPFISGQYSGRVKSLFNDKGDKTRKAAPSMPVQVLGFSGLPQAGDTFIVLESERDVKQISFNRQQIRREIEQRKIKHVTLDEISRRIKDGEVKELSIIIKADVDGSSEALSDSLVKLSNNEVAVNIIHKGVGAISESDVLLAMASDAVIIGFHVRPTVKAREIARREKVDIRIYTVIYDAISDVKDALEGLLEPEFEEKNLSVVEVRDIFKVPKVGTVAGCYVVSGKVTRNDKAKLYRDDKLIHDGRITSLKRFKEDVKEVASGFECGMAFENFDDIKVNDIIETYKIEEIKRKLIIPK